eukprot:353561-Chlamydomonas_euryale.AAC.4
MLRDLQNQANVVVGHLEGRQDGRQLAFKTYIHNWTNDLRRPRDVRDVQSALKCTIGMAIARSTGDLTRRQQSTDVMYPHLAHEAIRGSSV